MRPKALKANKTLTPLEVAELLCVLLGVGVLEVLEGVVELECTTPLEAGVEVGLEEDRVTPCTESGKMKRNRKRRIKW